MARMPILVKTMVAKLVDKAGMPSRKVACELAGSQKMTQTIQTQQSRWNSGAGIESCLTYSIS